MTNNPTIDGVSRDLLERIFHGCMFSMSRHQHDELRALLDADKVNNREMGLMQFVEAHPIAPAVERQEPVAYANPKAFENFGRLAHLGGLYAHEWMFASPAPELVPLYLEPPEVAALQSTIAQLEDRLNKAIDLDFQRRETIARLEARVQELESGRGVVAAYRIQHQDGYWCTWGSGPVSEGDLQDVADGVISGIEVAYAAPPAPVAVELLRKARGSVSYLSLRADDIGDENHALLQEINACLDANAALNGERK